MQRRGLRREAHSGCFDARLCLLAGIACLAFLLGVISHGLLLDGDVGAAPQLPSAGIGASRERIMLSQITSLQRQLAVKDADLTLLREKAVRSAPAAVSAIVAVPAKETPPLLPALPAALGERAVLHQLGKRPPASHDVEAVTDHVASNGCAFRGPTPGYLAECSRGASCDRFNALQAAIDACALQEHCGGIVRTGAWALEAALDALLACALQRGPPLVSPSFV